jgi:hypothetical protein
MTMFSLRDQRAQSEAAPRRLTAAALGNPASVGALFLG